MKHLGMDFPRHLIGLLASVIVSICLSAKEINAFGLGDELLNITRTVLGSEAFKDQLSKKGNFVRDKLNIDVVVRELATDIQKKITDRELAVAKLKDAVKRSFYRQTWGQYKECCSYDEFDLNFPGKVDVNSLCVMKSSSAAKLDDLPNNAFLGIAKENILRYPGIKSQYFGSDNGTLLRFPAAIAQSCGDYDNRFRPWYVQASAPVQKDIVLLLDMSGSMKMLHRLEATIHAATTILETLGPNDRVAVIAFSDEAYVVGSSASSSAISDKYYGGSRTRNKDGKTCFDGTMLTATPKNIKHLTAAVKRMVSHDVTNYIPGLKMAFDLLYRAFEQDVQKLCTSDNSGISSTQIAWSRHRAIVFLSDGQPTDAPQKILDLIYHRNREMHNSVVILCYALGDGTFGPFVRKMSQQKHSPTPVPDCDYQIDARSTCLVNGSKICDLQSPKEGLFQQVGDSKYLRSEMGSYYTFFASQNEGDDDSVSPDIVWSVPYFDAGGSGMVFTAATPVILEGHLVGVIGTDVTVREMMADVTYFHAGGQEGYAFVMDKNGRALLHPYMPSPATVSENPVLTDIGAFERTPSVKQFLNDILQKSNFVSGGDNVIRKLTVQTKVVLPQDHRNVDAKDVTMQYNCVQVKHLVLCVVVQSTKNSHIKLRPQNKESDFSFLYHRFDIKPPEKRCRYNNKMSSGDSSSVFLAPAAFSDASTHLGRLETHQQITKIKSYMNDNSGLVSHDDVNLRAGIRDVVRLTSCFNEIWKHMYTHATSNGGYKDTRHEIGKNVLYRYFSSENGVFRILPGITMPKSYNPIHRPWYIQAHALLNEIISEKPCDDDSRSCGDVAAVSPPYLDATGAGVIVTISQAIVTPVSSDVGTTTWHVVGVVAGDLKLSYLKHMLYQSEEECNEKTGFTCILMDLAGYIIYDSLLADMDESTLQHIVKASYHVTSAHRMLADELFRQNILVKKQCADISKVAYVEEFRVDLHQLEKAHRSLPFKAKRINMTNIVLLIIPKDLSIRQYFGQKECIKHREASAECERPVGSHQCESPCINLKEAELDYEVCTNAFAFTWDNKPPPCIPDKFVDERFGFVVEEDGSRNIRRSDIFVLKPCFDAILQIMTSAVPTGIAIAIAIFTLVMQHRAYAMTNTIV